MKNLNENETKALNAILSTCDDLDGEMFTRLQDAVMAVMEVFDFNGQVAGGYISDLISKGYLDEEDDEFYGTGLWVNV